MNRRDKIEHSNPLSILPKISKEIPSNTLVNLKIGCKVIKA